MRALVLVILASGLAACGERHRESPSFDEITRALSREDIGGLRTMLGATPAASDKEIAAFLRRSQQFFPVMKVSEKPGRGGIHNIVATIWNLEVGSRRYLTESFEVNVENADGYEGTLRVAYCSRNEYICELRVTMSQYEADLIAQLGSPGARKRRGEAPGRIVDR